MTYRDARWQPVPGAEELPEDEILAVKVGGLQIGVCRIDETYYAFDNVCTHAYALLSDGWLEGRIVECPLHGGRFDVTTGEALGAPVICPLKTYPTRLVDGLVEIDCTGAASPENVPGR